MIRETRHTGLVVRNLERSLAFYEALGLRVWKRDKESGPFIETVVGIPGVRLEWVKLRASCPSPAGQPPTDWAAHMWRLLWTIW